MYAIIEDSGSQLRVEEGQTLEVDLRPAEPGAALTFDRVLLLADEKGVRVGKPLVEGATVTAEVLGQTKGPKLEVVKVRRRKSSRTHTGHRQGYLTVRVTSIKG
ncbi:MAG TPA: 50S ribosomal protein L21 [Phycisphaerae bacterium]|nr:50S ribosomal protein L21 [Phycisphaerae bacterium]